MKSYEVVYYTSVNASEPTREIVSARNLSEAREIAQVHGAVYIQSAQTFEYVDLP